MRAPTHQTRAHTDDPNDTPYSRHTDRMHATCTCAPAFCSITLEYKGLGHVLSALQFSSKGITRIAGVAGTNWALVT